MSAFKIAKREAPCESAAVKAAKARGWMVKKISYAGDVDSWPDRLFIKVGRAVFIEFKAPGKEPSEKQYKRHEELRQHGALVAWFDNAPDALRWLDMLDMTADI